MENLDEYFALENSTSQSEYSFYTNSPCCDYFPFDFPSNSFDFLQFGSNSSNSSSESANLVQNQSNFFKLESESSISSFESMNLEQKEIKCFEFESETQLIIDSSESAELMNKQRDFFTLESQPSISSSESIDFVGKVSNCFEFEYKPKIIIDLTSPKSSKRKSSLKSDLFRIESQPSISSSESMNFGQKKRKCFDFGSEPSISSSESTDFVKKESKCFEFESKPKIIIDLTSPKSSKFSELKSSSKDDHFFGLEWQSSISSFDSIDLEQRFEFQSKLQAIVDITSPQNSQVASSKSRNLKERKPSLKIDLPPVKKLDWIDFGNSSETESESVLSTQQNASDEGSTVDGGVKQRREAEEGGEEVAVQKIKKCVEEDDSVVKMEWPLTPSRWNSFWDQNSNGMFNVPLLSPLSPHPSFCPQLMVV